RPSARLTALAAVAALLVVALLAGVLLTLRATVGNRPAPHPTPSPRCCIGVTEFPLPTRGSAPGDITVGPDGNLWFTENEAYKIGRLRPKGTLTELSLPAIQRKPQYLAASPDGNLWFTVEDEGSALPPPPPAYVGRLTPGGSLTEFPLGRDRVPLAIIVG